MPEWNDLLKQEQFRWRDPDERVQRFALRLRAAGLHSVMDLGCGAGRHTVFLAQQGFAVIGLDSAVTGLQATSERLSQAGQSASLVSADMLALPFADGSLDAVVSVYVIHHHRLAGIQRTVEEVGRVLKPGGLALLDVSSTVSWRYAHEEATEVEPRAFVPAQGNEAGMAHRYFDETEARQLFSGLKVVDFYLNEYDLLSPEGAVHHHGQWTAILTR